MCGIWAVFGYKVDVSKYDKTWMKIAHRGPDAWRIECDNNLKNGCVGFHRLTINNKFTGMQPLKSRSNPHLSLVCNGEIYNFKRLAEEFDFKYESECDAESIFHLYEKFGADQTASRLDGDFAFCVIDSLKRRVVIARDPFGLRPVFRMTGPNGVLGICSEAKGLNYLMEGQLDWEIGQFPPGHFAEYQLDLEGRATLIREQRYYEIGDVPQYKLQIPQSDYSNDIRANIRLLLTAAIKKRLMPEHRIGCLLSGGLDSSLIAALLVKLAKEAGATYKVQTFSIGMDKNGPELKAAREVAVHIGSEHHEVTFSEDDVITVSGDVFYHLESTHLHTVCDAIPMYLLCKYIKEKTDCTLIFSGDGADEVAMGNRFFKEFLSSLPGKEAHEVSLAMLNNLYMVDALRVDRITSAHRGIFKKNAPGQGHWMPHFWLPK